MPDQSTHW